ncbi:hsp70 protein [Sarocladium implicatum]|nr:hsp70 protein [Sarocladium implicatum]
MAASKMSPLKMLLGAVFFFSAQVFAASAVLGVDLGTEYIKAALVKPGIPLEIVLTKDTRRKETSAVAFKPTRGTPQDSRFPERLYGADAMAIAPRFPADVYPNLKSVLGLDIDDSVVQEYAARHPAMQILPHPSRNTASFKSKTFSADEEAWMVEELLAMELQSIQRNAEVTAGDGSTVRSVVLTVPPFYTIDEKRAIQTAADLAGLKVLSLVSDGLAVGLNYATSRQFPNINDGEKPEYHMVFDMGAGSTKATLMKFQSRSVKDIGKFNKTVQEVQVLGSGWDRTLGGDALNNLIVDDMIAQFVESKGATKISATTEGVKAHGRAIAKLSKEASRVRHVLSANQNTQASFEGLYEDVDFKYKLTRAEFEKMAEAHAERVAAAINEALKMANLDIADLTSVILHGGASRTPFVQKALEKIVGSADKIRSNVNSDEAAVFGAGFRAAELSPSFRVKEIRIMEGSMYAGGLSWQGSKDKSQKQRLWGRISPLGGPPKEVTFSEHEDFDVTFWQEIDAQEKSVAKMSTKNLTATVAAFKEKYPSCEDSEVFFRVGLKLNGDNGEVEVVKAAVECEAEVKEGFVDGVKNLFGFGKKDQEASAGEEADSGKTEGSEEVMKEDAKASESSASTSSESASSATGAEASGSAEDVKAEIKKKLVGIPVNVDVVKAGTPQLTKDEVSKSKDRLKAFTTSDKARVAREEAMNQLEAFTYKIRDLLENDEFVARSTEAERTKLSEQGSLFSDWLYDEGADASKDDFKAKLKDLQALVSPIQKRVEEAEQRPGLIADLIGALDQTKNFTTNMYQQVDEYEAWQASASASKSASTSIAASESSDAPAEKATGDFDNLEDDTDADAKVTGRTMEEVAEEIGPVPPLYKREDLDVVIAVEKSIREWLDEQVPKQEALSPTADPVLSSKDLLAKREQLDKAGVDLAVKGVRNFEKKSKKATKSASDRKKTKTGSAAEEKKTLNFEDFADSEDGPKVFSGDDIEELMKKVQKEKEQWAKDEAAKEKGHDEL